jgi:hypothetical protein
MESNIRVGEFAFFLVNGGLNINIGDKEYRLNPAEVSRLLSYLNTHRNVFDEAMHSEQGEIEETVQNLPDDTK